MKYGNACVEVSPPRHHVVREFVETEDRHHRRAEVELPVEEVPDRQREAAPEGEPDESAGEGSGRDRAEEQEDVDPKARAAGLRPAHYLDELLPVLASKQRYVPLRPQLLSKPVEPFLERGRIGVDREEEGLGSDPSLIDGKERGDGRAYPVRAPYRPRTTAADPGPWPRLNLPSSIRRATSEGASPVPWKRIPSRTRGTDCTAESSRPRRPPRPSGPS